MDLSLTSFLEGSFSVLVAAFLLLRMERRMCELTKAITQLRHCQTCRYSPVFFAVSPDGDEPRPGLDYHAMPEYWTKEP